jgi:predicted ATPase/DNA-binding winged helix-turn-helix (wHTH) protein
MPALEMPPAGGTAHFGRFVLQPALRRLEKDGAQVVLGGRALDILSILVDRAGEIVSHQELQERVWRNVVVEPSSLRVQMTALRKALGENGENYIINIAGRGYCFVAPVVRALADPVDLPAHVETAVPALKALVGRDEDVRTVIARLVETRFVTIAGTGGVGKTALAVAVAHALVPAFGGAVYFLDLSEVASPHAAHVMLGRAVLRRFVVAEGAVQGLAESLQEKRLLIVLDCCDRFPDAMGELTATFVHQAPHVHVLATSRERLGGDGETVFALSPLAFPPDADKVPVEQLPDYSGIQLLKQLVSRSTKAPQPDEADVRALARVTKQLDGLPLALELAAASILQGGIAHASSMADSRFALYMTDPATTIPRHASLNATLEWSYGQLTPEQRIVFRNLAVFAGPFTMTGIHKVAADEEIDPHSVNDVAKALLAKSMMYLDAGPESLRYRMLDTTRAFGLSKLITFGDGELVRRRHAAYITHALTLANAGGQGVPTTRLSDGLIYQLPNIRAALEWCFCPHGDATLGARLAAASAHVFGALWLNDEIHAWLTKALNTLDEQWRGTKLELELRAAILTNIAEPENVHLIPAQLPAIIELADRFGSQIYRVEARAWDIMLMAVQRPINESMERAQTLRQLAASSDDYPTRLLGDWLLGLTCHLSGALERVAPLCESATTISFSSESIFFSGAQNTAWVGAVGSLARTLWLQGQPEKALRIARAAISGLGRGISDYRLVRKFFVPLFIWAGAFGDAEDLLATVDQESGHALDVGLARMYLAALNLRTGNHDQALAFFQESYGKLYGEADKGMVATGMAEAYALRREFVPALQAIACASAAGEKLGESFFTPERLRVTGMVAALEQSSDLADAETWFLRAIDCATRQGSLSFALRAVTSLARFYQGRGSEAKAHAMLAGIYNQFTEGLLTPDLVEARDLLDALQNEHRAPARLAMRG